MARTCTICSHPKLLNIDRQLLRGDMLNSIAHRFHVSPDAIGRHRRHMRTAMLKAEAAAEKTDLIYGQTLIDEVKAIKADAERLQIEAEGRQDIRAALQAIRERVAIVELQAKLMGEIQTGNRSVTVNLQAITPEEALEYARDVIALLGPGTAPQPEPSMPLIESDADPSAMELNNGKLSEHNIAALLPSSVRGGRCACCQPACKCDFAALVREGAEHPSSEPDC